MRDITGTRARWLALVTLSTFAVLAPTASADTTLPVWTCRASAGYVETPTPLGTTRIEPVFANGFPNSANPDTSQCASTDAGVQNVNIPAGGTAPNQTPAVTLTAAFARTQISPEIAATRDQTVTAAGGVLRPLTIVIGTTTITADAVSADARGSCIGTEPTLAPTLAGTSNVVNLRINGGAPVQIPANGDPVTIAGSPIVVIRFNEQVRAPTAATATTPAGAELTQRAVHIQLLPTAGAAPVANVVLGEAKSDYHGAVCAPPPPPPTCPAGSVAQDPAATPLTCIQPVTAPCPAGSTADPTVGGACVIVRPAAAVNCPASSVRDPATNNCILVVQRPCPAGAKPDPKTRVCVVTVVKNVGTTTVAGENGRVGGSGGPVATCGRVQMHFVKGGKRFLTNRYGNRVVTRGKLVTCGSNPRPIFGARIDVVHVLPGGKRLRKTGLRSRSGGELTLILPLDLRSRKIEYAYRPDLRKTKVSSRVVLSLTVRDRNGRVLNK